MGLVRPEQWEELDRDFDSEYYLLGNVTPVRVLIRKSSGLQSGAIAPDVETGELVWRTTLLSRLDVSPEVEEISKEEFDRLCQKENVGDKKKG